MKDGVIADYDMTTDLLKHIMKKPEKNRHDFPQTECRRLHAFRLNSR